MKKIFLSFCIFLFPSQWGGLGWGFAQSAFQKTFGGTAADVAESIRQTSDGGYILNGYTYTYGAGSADAYLVKTDAQGILQWSKTFGGTASDNGFSVRQTTDGGYVFCGSTTSMGLGASDVLVIKTDGAGNLQWGHTFGGAADDIGADIIQTSDGGFAVVGSTKSFGMGLYDWYLLKLDPTGSIMWSRTWGDSDNDYAEAVIEAPNGNLMVAGHSESFFISPPSISQLVLFSQNGTFIASRGVSGVIDDGLFGIARTSDGGFLAAGYSQGFGSAWGAAEIYLMKTDSLGIYQWAKGYGDAAATSAETAYDIQSTLDGKFIITGYTQLGAGILNTFLLKTNSSGNVLWMKGYGGAIHDEGHCVHSTTDGGYAIGGFTQDFGHGFYDLYQIKTDTSGNSGGCNDVNISPVVSTQSAFMFLTNAGSVTVPATGMVSPGITVTSPFTDTLTVCGSGCPPPIANAGSNVTICSGQNVILTASGGTAYSWNTGATTSAITITPASTSTYSVIVSSACGSDTDAVTVTVNPTPVAGITSSPNIANSGTFQKTYGGTGSEQCNDVIATSDGGFLLAGGTTSFGAGDYDIYLVKLDAAGVIQWNKTYGTSNKEIALDVWQTTDGGYIATGYAYTSAFTEDAFLLKTDASGNLQWDAYYNTGQYDDAYNVLQASDGGYAVAGLGTAGSGAYLLKTDANGILLWKKSYSTTAPGNACYYVNQNGLQQTNDGGFIMAVFTGNFNLGNSAEFFLIKTDSNGTMQWAKTYGGTADEVSASVQQTTDNGYIITGYTMSYGSGGYDIYLMKVDSAGVFQWNKTFGTTANETGLVVHQTSDGGYIINAFPNSPPSDAYLLKTDSSGNLQWSNKYGTTNNEFPASMKITNTGGYVIGGTDYTLSDFFCMKIDNMGLLGGCEQPLSLPVTTPVPSVTDVFSLITTNTPVTTTTSPALIVTTPTPIQDSTFCGASQVCSGNPVTLTASGGGTYSWSTGATTISIVIAPTTTSSYSVTVSNGSCSDTASINVSVVTVNAAVAGSATICTGDVATLTASGGGTYSWSTGATSSAISVAPTTTTNYSVLVSNGSCTDTAIATVTVNPSVTANITGNTSLCSGQVTTLTATGGSNYSWNTGATTSSITAAATAAATYSVIVSSGSCADTASVTLFVAATPTASITGNTTICSGQTATLTASGGGDYLWNTGATNNSISVSPTTTTSYSVVVTSANGCTAVDTVAVNVTSVPVATISPNSTICAGEMITLTAGGGATYSWSNGATNSFIVVSPLANTTYSVIVANGNCFDTASATVAVNPNPTANAGVNITINYGNNATLTASGGGTYLWNTGENSSAIVASPLSTTIYCVTVTDVNGCTDSSCVKVTVELNCGELFIPNAFSPNGDGKNDVFRVRSPCLKTIHLVVYDRWGNKVFETSDITEGWDGNKQSSLLTGTGEAQQGVYVYRMEATLLDGTEVRRKGNVSLIR